VRKLITAVLTIGLLSFFSTAQAGHLFTQASANSPIVLAAGQGIDIPQNAVEGGSGQFSIYLANWSAGDIFRIVVAGVSQTFDFNNPFAGQSQSSSILNGSVAQTAGLAATNLGIPGIWRFEALAGNFTLNGYRISTVGGKLDGTGAGTVNQVNVTPNEPGIPAPSVLLLMLAGLGGLLFARKKATVQAVCA